MRPIRLVLLFICLYMPAGLFSQTPALKVFVDHMPDQRVYLLSVEGSDQHVTDSTLSSKGSFVFQFDDKAPHGLYRVLLGSSRQKDYFGRQTKGFDVIYGGKDIQLATVYESPLSAMKVIRSEQNRVYVDFVRTRAAYTAKFNALYRVLSLYAKDDPFYNQVAGEFVKVQRELTDSLIVLSRELPGTFVSSLISVYPEPVFDPRGSEQIDAFMREHYFDLVSFDDPALIHSDAYTSKIINYLGFFSDRAKGKEEQEKLFTQAVDKIMEEADTNQEIYDFVLNFLVDGFERFKMEDVLVYIADNYLEGECETDSEKIMQDRLEAYKQMAIGQRTGDIVLPDADGQPQRLSDMDNDITLLIFWASWCPHCQDLMPRLKKWYADQPPGKRPGIYSVSIDTSRTAWESFVKKNDLPGVNVLEPKGWEGKVAQRFNIYATPTMFLLDRDRRIMAKPVSFRELKQALDGIYSEAN